MIAIFASLNFVCDVLIIPQFSSGIWYGLIYLIEPLTGIVLGPYKGFMSTFFGVMIGHFLVPRGTEEFLFTLGAPIGAMISGLVFRRRWKPVFIYYTLLLSGYFITPISWQLPSWGIWDIYCAYVALLIFVFLMWRNLSRVTTQQKLHVYLTLCSFIGLEADILFRIFVFIPGQTYRLIYGFQVEFLQILWVSGAIITPMKVAVSLLFTVILGNKVLPILKNQIET